MIKDDKLIKIVNSSGFPLQISIENLVEETKGETGWHVLATEHAWKNDLTGENGFIDLILEDRERTKLLNVECKRVQNSSWIFLQPTPELKMRRLIKAWASYYTGGEWKNFGWNDMSGTPSTAQSQFCVVPGQDSKAKPMLERVAAEVVSATESFAHEDKNYMGDRSEYLRIFFNIIVTTAELRICNFDPKNVSIENGEIKDIEFQIVPYLRFRKQLSTNKIDNIEYDHSGYRKISKAKENTVFIVNSSNFIDFLKKFDVDG
jgi:hypothetical protein